MKCIDTDLLIAIMRGKDKAAKEKIDELDQDGRQATTTVNAFELFYGAHLSREKTSNVDKTKAMLNRLDIFTLDLDSSEKSWRALV